MDGCHPGLRRLPGRIAARQARWRCDLTGCAPAAAGPPKNRRAGDTDEGGRGLQLIAALSQRWGTRYTSHGKCIWTEQLLP
ncbi:hypothetical protein CA983_01830 [Streptomyces swartbergensis]|uniref:Histidine kinase/HSP90-like ATPase domain-containing protein n=1 Tax=Streptomyces swartbergensis TaxID=487165 RepID=A0A243SB54_9ACTN|nr:hypothetical protein CA983_01830 [Streptomyces swartbergensis]